MVRAAGPRQHRPVTLNIARLCYLLPDNHLLQLTKPSLQKPSRRHQDRQGRLASQCRQIRLYVRVDVVPRTSRGTVRARPPSPGLAGILKVHNCFINPDYLTDRVLLDVSGCYNGDLVDVFFHEVAQKYATQTAKLSLAYSLSVLGGKGEHVHKPEDLVKFGSHLDFATPPGIMPFPISITTHAGGPDERASNDYHYSAAVYSVSRNQIFHADSLSYPAHTYLATIQLAEWIVNCAEKRGTAIDKPEYIGVPRTQQGRTMHCGPTSVLNNRLIITHLQGPPVRTRFKTSYPDVKFS